MTDSAKMFDLRGRVAILTGGAGLLGREYAAALADAGAHVIIADINLHAARNLALAITERVGIEARGVETDVSSKPSVQAMVEQTLARFGRIDILVNNAALDPKFDPEHVEDHVTTFEA